MDVKTLQWNKEAMDFYEKFFAENMTGNYSIFLYKRKDLEKIVNL